MAPTPRCLPETSERLWCSLQQSKLAEQQMSFACCGGSDRDPASHRAGSVFEAQVDKATKTFNNETAISHYGGQDIDRLQQWNVLLVLTKMVQDVLWRADCRPGSVGSLMAPECVIVPAW